MEYLVEVVIPFEQEKEEEKRGGLVSIRGKSSKTENQLCGVKGLYPSSVYL